MTDQPTPQHGADDRFSDHSAAPAEQPTWSAAQPTDGQPTADYQPQYPQAPYEYPQAPYQYPGGGYDPGAGYQQAGHPYAESGNHGGYQQGPYAYQQAGYQQGPYGQAGASYGQAGYQPGGYPPPYGYWAPPPVPRRKHKHRFLYGTIAAAVAAAVGTAGITAAVTHSNDSSQTSLSTPAQTGPFGNGNSGGGTGESPFGPGQGGSGQGGSSSAGTASAAQSVGVVDIDTVLDYGRGKAAGTGIVLSSSGEVLTNNHVVQDSTAISVTVVSTGKTYTAKVVGTDPSDDVAVIQLQNASGLATAKLGNSSAVKVGSSVTAVGNAGGTGGTPSAAPGTVTGLNQSITASDNNGSNSERLTGMIEVAADVQAGDSGGPLYDNASGKVVGMDTAASSSGSRFQTSVGTAGFAIPIENATKIAGEIENGTDNATIHQGYPAFLGVQLSPNSQSAGAAIAGVVPGSGAAKAGLAAGDVITSVNGNSVSDASALSGVLRSHQPGDKITVGYTDISGASHTVTVTLGEGPAD